MIRHAVEAIVEHWRAAVAVWLVSALVVWAFLWGASDNDDEPL